MHVRPTHGGRPLSFSVSGKLWKDALIMYDRETGSFWSRVTGTAVHGKLAGTTLRMYPAIQTTWAEWKKLYPTGHILSKRSSRGYTGTRNVYEGYFADENRLGTFGTQNPDKSLPAHLIYWFAWKQFYPRTRLWQP